MVDKEKFDEVKIDNEKLKEEMTTNRKEIKNLEKEVKDLLKTVKTLDETVKVESCQFFVDVVEFLHKLATHKGE